MDLPRAQVGAFTTLALLLGLPVRGGEASAPLPDPASGGLRGVRLGAA
ncbi:hypothetical protein [Gemmobacter serpentinus]|nr:hypothetical protein [Gemmobacter serpentinus]